MSIPFVLFLFSLLVLAFVVGAVLLHLINRFYGITESSFGRVALILLISGFVSIAVNLGGLILPNASILFSLFAILASLSVAYLLYRKFFQVGVGKFLAVHVTWAVSTFILGILIVVPTRLFLFEPFLVSSNSAAPAYNNGDYLILEKWDKTVRAGDTAIVAFLCDGKICYSIKQAEDMAGETVIGKPILNLGQVFR